jgi:hypothetical protein
LANCGLSWSRIGTNESGVKTFLVQLTNNLSLGIKLTAISVGKYN